MPELKATWDKLTAKSNQAATMAAWADLIARYTEADRAYHNREHLAELLAFAHHYRKAIKRFDLLCWAIFYHDVIYVPGNRANEEHSALMAENWLPKLGVSEQDVAVVASWIRASASHVLPAAASSEDGQLFLDMDMAILGASEQRYRDYVRQVRKEFRKFPNFLYKPGRRKVLTHFLAQERIYKSQQFFDRFEEAARKNIAWELENL